MKIQVSPLTHVSLSSSVYIDDGCGAQDVTLDPVPTELADRFRVIEPLGRGQSGSLYLVEEADGRQGVLKLLHSKAGTTVAERQRLKRELVKQATLGNPYLTLPLVTGEAGGVTWFFRDMIRGETLRARLARDSKLAVPEALTIAAQLATALDELHRAGLLHRDLKPGHIFLVPDGSGLPHVQVIDAGVAARLDTETAFDLIGTPSYVSPEQATGKLVSFRSDLYALGCVLWEMLTGSPPFTGETPQEILTAHAETSLPEPPADLSEGARELLVQLLHKEPRERPFSAQQVRRALEPMLPETAGAVLTESQAGPTNGGRPKSSTLLGMPAVKPPLPPSERPKPPQPPSMRAKKPSSVPPPPPPESRRKSSAPPPPVPGAKASADATQELDALDIEEVAIPNVGLAAPAVPSVEAAPTTPGSIPSASVPGTVEAAPSVETGFEPEVTAPAPPPSIDPVSIEGAVPPVEQPAPQPLQAQPSVEQPSYEQPSYEQPSHAQPSYEQPAPQASAEQPAIPPTQMMEAYVPPSEQQPATAVEQPPIEHPQAYAPQSAEASASATGDDLDYDDLAETIAQNREPSQPFTHVDAQQQALDQAVQQQAAAVHAVQPAQPAYEVNPPVAYEEPPKAKSKTGLIVLVGIVAFLLGTGGAAAVAILYLGSAEESIAMESPSTHSPAPQPSAPVPAPAVEPSEAAPADPGATETEAVETEPAEAVAAETEPAEAAPAETEPAEAAPAETESAPTAAERRAQERAQRQQEREAQRAQQQAQPAQTQQRAQSPFEQLRTEARDHFRARRFPQAAQAYERAAAMNPNHPGVFSGLGAARSAMGDSRGAIAAYQRAVELAPNHSGYYAALGRAYASAGDRARAAQAYQRAVALDPNNAAARQGLQRLGM